MSRAILERVKPVTSRACLLTRVYRERTIRPSLKRYRAGGDGLLAAWGELAARVGLLVALALSPDQPLGGLALDPVAGVPVLSLRHVRVLVMREGRLTAEQLVKLMRRQHRCRPEVATATPKRPRCSGAIDLR